MPWVRLDDGYPEHPKVDRVGPLAAWLNVCAWAYCARNLTDGFVPAERVARLATVPNPAKLAAILVDAHLWEPADGGYVVHDYLVYNPSREQVLAERARTAERVAKHRNSGSNGVTPPDTNSGTNDRSTPVGNGVSTPAPYPSRSRTRKLTHPGPEANPPVPSGHPPLGQRRVTVVDDAFRLGLEEQFQAAFGSRQAVRDVMDHAMGHKALLKCSDQRAYLRNWVRDDAEKAIQRRKGRGGLALIDPGPEPDHDSLPEDETVWVECPSCGKRTTQAHWLIAGRCGRCHAVSTPELKNA